MPVVDFQNIRRKAQALYIQYSLSNTIDSWAKENHEETKTAAKEEISTLQEDLNGQSESLTSALKGKFGKKEKETIETESEKVDNF